MKGAGRGGGGRNSYCKSFAGIGVQIRCTESTNTKTEEALDSRQRTADRRQQTTNNIQQKTENKTKRVIFAR
jgi:hypothetical protein